MPPSCIWAAGAARIAFNGWEGAVVRRGALGPTPKDASSSGVAKTEPCSLGALGDVSHRLHCAIYRFEVSEAGDRCKRVGWRECS